MKFYIHQLLALVFILCGIANSICSCHPGYNEKPAQPLGFWDSIYKHNDSADESRIAKIIDSSSPIRGKYFFQPFLSQSPPSILNQLADTIIGDTLISRKSFDFGLDSFFVFSADVVLNSSLDSDDSLQLQSGYSTNGDKYSIFKKIFEAHSVFFDGFFTKNTFTEDFYLGQCEFDPIISECTFRGNARIAGINLLHSASKIFSIEKSKFYQNIYFNEFNAVTYPKFYKDSVHLSINMENDSIRGSIDLSRLIFEKGQGFSMKGCSLPDTINLEGSIFSGPIELTEINVGDNENKKCRVVLSPSAADNIDLQYKNFELTFLHGENNDSHYIDYIESIYEKLLKNFNTRGYKDSYELLDIQYKEWLENQDWTLVLSDYWWKFGYQKSRIILWTLGLIIFFSFFNRWKFSKLQHAYPVENLQKEYYDYSGKMKRWMLGMKQFVISILYTSLIFFKVSVDFNKINFERSQYALIIIFQYTIGLVCTGFLVNWILKG